jgi:predicted ATPase/DNA-binding CsgD family transcriptional regulator
MRTDSKQATSDSLTPRERDILRLIAEGLSNRDIADTLFFSLNTVKWYITQIYSKLGVTSRTQALAEAQQRHLLDEEAASVSSPDSNLPVYTTPLIGRADELARLAELMRSSRLITLVGPGGIGKMRLALEAAAQASSNFEHGAHFVALAPLTSSDQIVPAIADAVGFQFPPGDEPHQSLLRYLKQKHMLLVLDNFEHLLDGADIVTDILAAAPYVRILATAREPLSLQPETVFMVGGLPVSASNEITDAMALFLDYAGRAKPGFDPEPGQVEQVAHICQALDGMPLALILAAGWLRLLTLAEIAAEIGKSLDLLEAEWRDLPERQRSMRAVFDHSWRLLTTKEQQVFQRLSVFRGGFTREPAEAVAGASLRTLASLVNKSMLRRDPASGRYDLHELLRQYGEEQLVKAGLEHETSSRHSLFFLETLASCESGLKGGRQIELMQAIEADMDNIAAAWEWAAQHTIYNQMDAAVHTLWLYFEMRSRYIEGEALFARMAALLRQAAPEPSRDRVLRHVLICQIYLNNEMAKFETSDRLVQENQDLLSSPDSPRFRALQALALSWRWMVSHERYRSQPYCEEALRIYRQLGDSWGIAHAMDNLSRRYWSDPYSTDAEIIEARRLAEESNGISRAAGDFYGMVQSLVSLMALYGRIGLLDEVRRAGEESLELCQKIKNLRFLAVTHTMLAISLVDQEKIADARFMLEESLRIHREAENIAAVTHALSNLAVISFDEGDFELAKAYRAEVLGYASETQSIYIDYGQAGLAECEWALGNFHAAEALLQQAFNCGEKNPFFLAQDLLLMSEICRIQGKAQEAERYRQQGFQMAQAANNDFTTASYNVIMSRIHLEQGDLDAAGTHLNAAHQTYTGLKTEFDFNRLFTEWYGASQLFIVFADFNCASGQLAQAWERIAEGLSLSVLRRPAPCLTHIACAADLWAAESAMERAVEVASFVQHETRAFAVTKARAARTLERLRTELSPDSYTGACTRGKALSLDGITALILNHLEAPSG